MAQNKFLSHEGLTYLLSKLKQTFPTIDHQHSAAEVEQVQADINQNDASAPDYVKNRTHWKEGGLTVIVPESVPEVVGDDDSEMALQCAALLQVGETYIVTVNGTEYTCVGQDVSAMQAGAVFIGNCSVLGIAGLTGNGEPFIMGTAPALPGLMMFMTLTDGDLPTISVYHDGVTVHKLPNEYLDMEWIPKPIEELVAEEENAADYCQPWLKPDMVTEGERLIVYVDGIRYEMTVQGPSGNGSFPNEKYLIGDLEHGDPVGLHIEEEGTTTLGGMFSFFHIKICREIPNRIPRKFLPEDMYGTEGGLVEVLPKVQMEYIEEESGDNYFMYMENVPAFTADTKYVVEWNGVQYTTTSIDCTDQMGGLGDLGGSMVALGDIYSLSGGQMGTTATGEPFAILCIYIPGESPERVIQAITFDGSTSLTLAIYENSEVIHKIPNKYLNLDWLPTITPTRVLAAEKTVTGSISQPTETTGGFPDLTSNDVTVGEDVLVIWDGEEYKLKVQQIGEDGDSTIFIGDINMLANGTGMYPFFLMLTASRTNVFCLGGDSETPHTASVMGYECNKIPSEYLPDDLVHTTRTINGKALSSDITLSASDVGALPSTTQIPSIAGLASESYVDTKVASLVDSAPETLDTLNELAAALGNDENFATTISTQIGNKVDKVEGMGLSSNDFTTEEKNKLAGVVTNLVDGSAVGSVRGIGTRAESDTYVIGQYAFVEGNRTKASGNYSHSEGYGSEASGTYSHSEGNATKAQGFASHAEGNSTVSSGDYSHSEGFQTLSNGKSSHTEGYCTVSTTSSNINARGQHVQGRFNLEDTDGVYAHIVGNGKGNNNTTFDYRSNAHTVDWSGNAWYQGDIYVGSTSGTNKDEGSKKVATEEYVDSQLVNLSGLPTVTAADAGKILRVSAEGIWIADSIPAAEDASF